MGATFEKALERNVLPRRLGDVSLGYETTMLVGRADKPARGLYAVLCLIAGVTFGLATLAAFLSREDDTTLALLVAPAVVAFIAAAWLEQRDRRQRVFVVDFDNLILRLDFSTPLVGMPRTLRVPFDSVRDVELSRWGARASCSPSISTRPRASTARCSSRIWSLPSVPMPSACACWCGLRWGWRNPQSLTLPPAMAECLRP